MHIATALAGYSAADMTQTADRRRRPSIKAADRAAVYARPESSHCGYCATPLFDRGSDAALGELHDGWRTLDHVVPLSLGGENTAANLVAVCRGCNKAKDDQTAEEFLASDYLAARRRTVARRTARAARRDLAAAAA